MLHIASSAPGMVELTWDGPAGFVLEESDDPANSAGWAPKPGGESSPVLVPVSGARKYYRLARP